MAFEVFHARLQTFYAFGQPAHLGHRLLKFGGRLIPVRSLDHVCAARRLRADQAIVREFVQGSTDRLDGHAVALGQLPPRRKPLAELESTCRHFLTQVVCDL